MRLPLRILSFLVSLTLGASTASAAAAPRTTFDPALLQKLAASPSARIHRIDGTPRENCARTDMGRMIECYRSFGGQKPPSDAWVREFLTLLSRAAWVPGVGASDTTFRPDIGVQLGAGTIAASILASMGTLRVVLYATGQPDVVTAVPESLSVRFRTLVGTALRLDSTPASRLAPIPTADTMHDGNLEVFVFRDCVGDNLQESDSVVSDEPPTPILTPVPEYPQSARDDGIQGKVVLHVLVGADGVPCRAKAIRGESVLLKAAAEAAKNWRYKPALSSGLPVPVWVEVPMDFHF